MDIHEFYKALGDALGKLEVVKGVEDRADAAQRRLQAKEGELAALADAHARLKADSDRRLADNLAKFNDETVKHNQEIHALKKQIDQLNELHKTQQENASATLTKLNADVAVARKEHDEMLISREKMRNEIIDLAKKI